MNYYNASRSLYFLIVFVGMFYSTVNKAIELVYVPVEPCRLLDTRATLGSIAANSTESFVAYGDMGELDSQGGNAGGCPNPKPGSTPVAIAANVTAVGNQASGNGNLVAYPYGSIVPSSSLVNYKVGTNIANAGIINLCEGASCLFDFNVQSNFSAVPAIVDVQGYFYPQQTGHVYANGTDIGLVIDASEFELKVLGSKGYFFNLSYDGSLKPGGMVFEGTNCTGNKYIPIYSSRNLVYGRVAYSPYLSSLYYAPINGTILNSVIIKSQDDLSGGCSNTNYVADVVVALPNDEAVTGVPDTGFTGPITIGQ